MMRKRNDFALVVVVRGTPMSSAGAYLTDAFGVISIQSIKSMRRRIGGEDLWKAEALLFDKFVVFVKIVW